MKIAFVGQPAVGKDAVAEYIARHYKLTHISSGDLIRAYVTENNLGGLDRTNLQVVGNKLRAQYGGDYLVVLALRKTPDNLILTGLRTIDEVETFKKTGGTVIAITAPIEFRYQLAKKRGRIGENISFEEFKNIEEQEAQNPDRNSQNVNQVIGMATIEVVNEGTLEELFEKVKRVVDGMRVSQ
ncbi:MAG: nucleoside monophosphate kinase [Candidatus Taylorbacteria bacterium]|nr:nucleoside monophosphate kinase [Candidatus Taylorbacteria bacterium]